MLAEDLFNIGLLLHYSGSKVLITDESDYAVVLSNVVKDVILVFGEVCCFADW